MKTVSAILKTLVVLSLLALMSCGSDDDQQGNDPTPPLLTDKFTVGNTDYGTTKAYLIIWKDGTEYANEYSFVFADGKIKEDLVNGLKLTTTTNHLTEVRVITGGANLATEQDVIDKASVIALRLNLSDDTMAITSIPNWNNTMMHNSEQYGVPEGFTRYVKYGVNVGNFTTNSFMANLSSRSGTIDCEYFFKDSNGVEVTGVYNGTFEIINENI